MAETAVTKVSFRERVTLAGRALVGSYNGTAARGVFGMLAAITPRGEPPLRGTAEFLAAYNNSPWVRAVVDKVIWQVAAAQWRLYLPGKKEAGKRRQRDIQLQRCPDHMTRAAMLERYKDAGELQEIPSHLVLDVLGNANAFLTGSQSRALTQAHLELVGEAYWIKERNKAGATIGVWPIPPTWVRATPTPEDRTFEVSFRGWHGKIPDTEVLWFRSPDVTNPYGRGVGQLSSLADNVDLEEFATKHQRQWFYNKARPDLVVMPDSETEGLEESEVKTLEHAWKKQHQGFWNAFKPFFATKKLKIENISQTFQDQQLDSVRKFERDVIIQNWGVPPEVFGILQNSNRSTIDVAAFHMAVFVTTPRLELWRETLQERLLPEYDPRLVIDYVSPIRKDKEFMLKVLQAAPWIANTDEYRKLADFEKPLEDAKSGKMFVVPVGMRLANSLAEAAATEAAAAEAAQQAQGQQGAAEATPAEETPPAEQPKKPKKGVQVSDLWLHANADTGVIELDAEVDGVWRQIALVPVDGCSLVLDSKRIADAPALSGSPIGAYAREE